MGMRSSDATFLRREVLPILAKAAAISPEAQDAHERLAGRLSGELGPEQTGWGLNKWFKVWNDDLTTYSWYCTIEYDGAELPYITGHYYDTGEDAGHIGLTLDRRFFIETDVEELGRWVMFLADAMAVSAGRTSHGPNSYIRNPHGRSGGGDPLPLVGEPVELEAVAPG